MKIKACLGLGLGIVALGCAAETGDDGEHAGSSESLALVIATADGSHERAVGMVERGELRFTSDFSLLLAQKSKRWVVRSGDSETALDLAALAVPIEKPLLRGETFELVAEESGAERTAVEIRVGSAPLESTGATASPTLQTESTTAGCWFQCNSTSDARTEPVTTCGSCGFDKRKYEYQVHTCTTCGLMCNYNYYGVTFACGPWQSQFSWCDYC